MRYLCFQQRTSSCLHAWVDGELEPHEDHLGLYKVDNIQTDTIIAILQDILKHLNLTLANYCDQCYDGLTTWQAVRVMFQPNLGRKSHVLSMVQSILQ